MASKLANSDAPAVRTRLGMMEDFVPPEYPLETHEVTTPDGWVLGVHRIPRGGQRSREPGPRPVVLMVHGFSLSSVSFALFNPNESLAYIMADAGFDVWMMNTRSNDFSRGHKKYNFKDAEYWYTSIDELALIDLPAVVDYVLATAPARRLGLLTHSQGGTLAYGMLSMLPHMADKLTVLVAMGPPVFLEYMRAPFLRSWADRRNDDAFGLASIGEFMWSRLVAPFIPQCRENFFAEFCVRAIFHAFYGPSQFVSIDDMVVVGQTWPATVASRDITHWAQMITDGKLRLQRYDYGTNCANRTRWSETCNQAKYGSLEPPEYDLSKIRAPVFILQGDLDIMVCEEDVYQQYTRIPGSRLLMYEGYSHMDFVWDRNMRHALDVVDIMFRFSPGSFG